MGNLLQFPSLPCPTSKRSITCHYSFFSSKFVRKGSKQLCYPDYKHWPLTPYGVLYTLLSLKFAQSKIRAEPSCVNLNPHEFQKNHYFCPKIPIFPATYAKVHFRCAKLKRAKLSMSELLTRANFEISKVLKNFWRISMYSKSSETSQLINPSSHGVWRS